MNEKYSALFTPWKIGNVEIKNRIVQPSMGGTSLFGWLEPCHFDKEAAYHILNRGRACAARPRHIKGPRRGSFCPRRHGRVFRW